MKFLTRKWQRAIRRVSVSGTVNGHAPGQLTELLFIFLSTCMTWLFVCVGGWLWTSITGSKAEVLRQQQPRSNSDSPPNRDSSAGHRDTVSSLVPPSKSPFRLNNRFGLLLNRLTFSSKCRNFTHIRTELKYIFLKWDRLFLQGVLQLHSGLGAFGENISGSRKNPDWIYPPSWESPAAFGWGQPRWAD